MQYNARVYPRWAQIQLFRQHVNKHPCCALQVGFSCICAPAFRWHSCNGVDSTASQLLSIQRSAACYATQGLHSSQLSCKDGPHCCSADDPSEFGSRSDRVSHSWQAETVQQRNRAMQELDSWPQTLPAERNKTLLSCTPADVVVYFGQSLAGSACWNYAA